MGRLSKSRAAVTPFATATSQAGEEAEERHAPQLERVLLRHSVRRMTAGRSNCAECGRSPLVGELLRVYTDKRGYEHPLCDLCLSGGAAPEGEPLRAERVRPGERPLAVRRAA
jgi:hypothetical protein